jgi:hypothetical protein
LFLAPRPAPPGRCPWPAGSWFLHACYSSPRSSAGGARAGASGRLQLPPPSRRDASSKRSAGCSTILLLAVHMSSSIRKQEETRWSAMSYSVEKKLTFAVALGREEQELRLVAAIFLSSARPHHFVLEASEDSIRLGMRLSTNRSWGRGGARGGGGALATG